MALIICSECGKEISDKSSACVGCGAPIEVQTTIVEAMQEVKHEAKPSEYWIALSNFWKKQKGRFQVYEDRIVFSKLHYIFGMVPTETKEYNVLISDLQGTSITTPEKINTNLIGGIFTIIAGIILGIFSTVLLIFSLFSGEGYAGLSVVMLPALLVAAYLVILGRFVIVESTNAILKISTQKLNLNDRTIFVAKNEVEALRKFAEDINRLQARDTNYILRNPGAEPNIMLNVTKD